jgi:predicted transcriptional regulator
MRREFRYEVALRLRGEGLSYQEIAARMGTSAKAVGALLYTARYYERRRARAADDLSAENDRLRAENLDLRAELRRRNQAGNGKARAQPSDDL